jgi:multiple sugar transport system substrate-binding protein
MLRRLAAVAAATMLALPASAAAAETITLGSWASSSAETALVQELIARFEERFPGIEVAYETLPGDYRIEMEARLVAGVAPDVFYVDSSYAPDWIAQGWLWPLHGAIQRTAFDTEPFFDPLLRAFERPLGKPRGLPKDWSPLVLFTNDLLLATAGIEAPSTWAELEAAAERITIPGGAPLCIDASWSRLLPLVYQNAGSFLSEDRRDVTINSPEAREAVEFYVDLVRRGLAATPGQLGVGWCGEAFAFGLSAMTIEGNWLVPFLREFPWVGYTINPMIRNVQRGNVAFTVSYSVAGNSEHKRAASEFVLWATGPQGMAHWVAGGLALPSRADVLPVSGSETFLGEADVSRVWSFAPGFAGVLDRADEQLRAVLAGAQTIQGMLAAIEADADTALSRD